MDNNLNEIKKLEFSNLSGFINGNKIFDNVNAKLYAGDWLAICGPNGCGKTSLINCFFNNIDYVGDIKINGFNIKEIDLKFLAQKIGIFNQINNFYYDFPVYDVVSFGRYPHIKLKDKDNKQDKVCIDKAIDVTGLKSFKNKSISHLSGGEQQRVFLAKVLAQDPDILILDEPTNNLDLYYQDMILKTVSEWLDNNKIAIMTTHDVTLCKKFSNKMLLIESSGNNIYGDTSRLFKNDTLSAIFNFDVFGFLQIKE